MLTADRLIAIRYQEPLDKIRKEEPNNKRQEPNLSAGADKSQIRRAKPILIFLLFIFKFSNSHIFKFPIYPRSDAPSVAYRPLSFSHFHTFKFSNCLSPHFLHFNQLPVNTIHFHQLIMRPSFCDFSFL